MQHLVTLAGIVDVCSRINEIKQNLLQQGFPYLPKFIDVPDEAQTDSDWKEIVNLLDTHFSDVDAVIIATAGIERRHYIQWAIGKGLDILADKPLTVRPYCSTDARQAQAIYADFEAIRAAAGRRVNVFMMVAQRRYQKSYRDIAKRVYRVARQTGYGATFIQCLTNDGLWHFPEDYGTAVSYHPQKSGGGKLIHTGYHILDTASWLMRFAESGTGIKYAEVYATGYFPNDGLAGMGQAGRPLLNGYAEVNAALQISFKNRRHDTLCILQCGLLHEGLSHRTNQKPASEKERTKTAFGGRTKQDFLCLYQGPVGGIFHNRIAKLGRANPTEIGGHRHTNVVYTANPHFTDFPSVMQKEYAYDPADSAPAIEFLDKITRGKKAGPSASPLNDHAIAIKLLSASYESLAIKAPVLIEFDETDWTTPPAIEFVHTENEVAL